MSRTPKNTTDGALIDEIAEEVGVSRSTVYRIMSGKASGRKATHQQVLRLLEQSGRTRARTRTTGRILCVTQRNLTAHAMQLLNGLSSRTRESGYELVIIQEPVTKLIDQINDLGALGVVYLRALSDPLVSMPQIPVVAFHTDKRTLPSRPAVDFDEYLGLARCLTHVRELGHRRVGFFNDYGWHKVITHPRRANMKRLYALADLPYAPELEYRAKEFEPGGHTPVIRKMVDHFLGLPEPPTALLLPGDYAAPDTYASLNARGLNVPRDMSVISIDDSESAAHMVPPLTTLRPPFEEMVEAVLELFLDRVRRPFAPIRRVLIESELIVRGSTAPPARAST